MHGPTWLVALVTYGGWLALTGFHARLPLPVLALLGGCLVALHGSLQHETIHGHPAGPAWVGLLLGAPPLSLWLPYEIYRYTHRRHHATHRLTDPVHDPEAPFAQVALGRGGMARLLRATQRTVLGRLGLGPPVTVGLFLAGELRAVRRNQPGHRRAWLLHVLALGFVLAWLTQVAHLSLGTYLLAFVYPGTSLTLLRSFVEHRVDERPERRTTVVEAGLFFRLLFLNNNFHVAHHAAPRAPWFELPRLWAAQREAVLERAPDLVHPGYLTVMRRRLLSDLQTRSGS
jgi:fatty acid desaturase